MAGAQAALQAQSADGGKTPTETLRSNTEAWPQRHRSFASVLRAVRACPERAPPARRPATGPRVRKPRGQSNSPRAAGSDVSPDAVARGGRRGASGRPKNGRVRSGASARRAHAGLWERPNSTRDEALTPNGRDQAAESPDMCTRLCQLATSSFVAHAVCLCGLGSARRTYSGGWSRSDGSADRSQGRFHRTRRSHGPRRGPRRQPRYGLARH